MGVFRDGEDEVSTLVIGNFFLLTGLLELYLAINVGLPIGVAIFGAILGVGVALAGAYVLVSGFRIYRVGPLKEFITHYYKLAEARFNKEEK